MLNGEILENFKRILKEKPKYPLFQHQLRTTMCDGVSLDLECVYGMFSFCGFIWNVLKSVPSKGASSRSESLANTMDF